jgi:hypothetical protein
MKATIISTLVAGVLCLCAVSKVGGEASAQGKAEAGRGPEAGVPNLQGRQPERARPLQRPGERAPSEDAPSALDEAPPVPGCQDQGRKLELIV